MYVRPPTWVEYATVIAAFFTCVAGLSSLASVLKIKKQISSNSIRELISYRYNKNFYKAKKILIKEIESGQFKKNGTIDPSEVNKIQGARHDFVVYFQKVRDFYNSRVIDGDNDLRILVNSTDLEVLFDAAKPIEEHLRTYRESVGRGPIKTIWGDPFPRLYDFYRQRCFFPGEYWICPRCEKTIKNKYYTCERCCFLREPTERDAWESSAYEK